MTTAPTRDAFLPTREILWPPPAVLVLLFVFLFGLMSPIQAVSPLPILASGYNDALTIALSGRLSDCSTCYATPAQTTCHQLAFAKYIRALCTEFGNATCSVQAAASLRASATALAGDAVVPDIASCPLFRAEFVNGRPSLTAEPDPVRTSRAFAAAAQRAIDEEINDLEPGANVTIASVTLYVSKPRVVHPDQSVSVLLQRGAAPVDVAPTSIPMVDPDSSSSPGASPSPSTFIPVLRHLLLPTTAVHDSSPAGDESPSPSPSACVSPPPDESVDLSRAVSRQQVRPRLGVAEATRIRLINVLPRHRKRINDIFRRIAIERAFLRVYTVVRFYYPSRRRVIVVAKFSNRYKRRFGIQLG